jgi:hypothetical protein
MPRLYLSVLLAGVLSGCQAPGPIDEDSPQAEIPPGAVFVLKQDLKIPAYDRKSLVNLPDILKNPNAPPDITFQHGEVIELRESARRESMCRLETQLRRSEANTINSDPFVAGRSSFRIEHAPDTDDRPFITRIPLESKNQPAVTALVCQNYGSPTFTTHLTIREIREVLGEIFSLELSPGAHEGTAGAERAGGTDSAEEEVIDSR